MSKRMSMEEIARQTERYLLQLAIGDKNRIATSESQTLQPSSAIQASIHETAPSTILNDEQRRQNAEALRQHLAEREANETSET